MWIFAQVIEFSRSIEVLDEAVAGAADRIIAQSETSEGGMGPRLLGILHERYETLPLLGRIGRQSGQFKQGWKNVEELGGSIAYLITFKFRSR